MKRPYLSKIDNPLSPKGATMNQPIRRLSAVIGAALVAYAITPQIALADTPTVTQVSYDSGDHVISVTDPRGLVTSYSYDGLGQLWQQVSPDTGTTNTSYDAYGRPASMTRADGTTTTYGYDSLSRTASLSAGGQTQVFTYDTCTNGIGRLCTLSDSTGSTSYTYTPEGWLSGRGFSIAGTTYALGYSYDAMGHMTAVNYPDGNQAVYSYSNGVVSTVQVNVGGNVSNAATGITYQPGDATMTQWTSSNGIANTLSYDNDGRLVGISAGNVQNLGLSFDSVDRIAGISNGIDGTMTQNFGYDAMSRLTLVNSNADSEALQYDANGNRTSQVINGSSSTVGTSATNNQVTGLSGGSNVTYGYDSNGNLTKVSGTPTFTYSSFNRLVAVTGATYYVNPEGQRLEKTVGNVSTFFAPSNVGSLAAENQGSGWIDYVWLNGRLIGRLYGGQILAVHDDQLGRPEAMTDASQAVVWRAHNFAFDRVVTVNNAVPLNLGFPGQYYDAETGIWNNGFRDYSAALGRYLESDPIGLNGGVNTYAYAGGNPVSFSDASGLLFGGLVNAGECYGVTAAQYWADKQTATGNSLYAIPGAFAALWTPDTSDDTFATLSTAAGAGSGSLARGAGQEWSHWIPARMATSRGGRIADWIVSSPLNGKFVSPLEHAMNDIYRARFFGKDFMNKGMNPFLLQQWNRMPDWIKGLGLAGAALAGGKSNCGCNN